MTTSTSEPFDLVIEAGRADRHYWRDLWRFRDLFYFLAWRDILVRYKQTVVGVAWALLRPILTMVVFTFIFGKVARMDSGGVPYPVLVFAGMLPWTLFASAFSGSSQSLIGNAGLISKVYFPRLILPISAVIVGCVEFLISFVMLIVLMILYGCFPGWRIVTLPFFTVIAFLAALGPALWIGALNVRYRDFMHVIPFIIQFGLYLSPVGFHSDVIREKFGDTLFALYCLNPMVGVIDGFRWALLGQTFNLYLPGFILSLIAVGFLLFGGIRYFRKTEKVFADVI
jgi:lipopolysaccharide transport system permease protein